MKAIWKGTVLAESPFTEVVEGNHYFPVESIKKEYLQKSTHESTCPWKGQAAYYSINVDGHENANAAWYYPKPKEAASNIRNYVAFWKGVEVTDK